MAIEALILEPHPEVEIPALCAMVGLFGSFLSLGGLAGAWIYDLLKTLGFSTTPSTDKLYSETKASLIKLLKGSLKFFGYSVVILIAVNVLVAVMREVVRSWYS